MGLPRGVLRRGEATLPDGQTVAVRGLARGEVLALNEMQGNLAEAEAYLIACGTDTPLEEVLAWHQEVPTELVDPIVTCVSELSGLTGQDGGDPERPISAG